MVHIFSFSTERDKIPIPRSVCKSESADDVWCRACVCHSWPPPPSSLLLWCYAKAGLMVVPFLAASPHCLLEIYQRGEAIHNQNWWFFGTFPNCLWPPRQCVTKPKIWAKPNPKLFSDTNCFQYRIRYFYRVPAPCFGKKIKIPKDSSQCFHAEVCFLSDYNRISLLCTFSTRIVDLTFHGIIICRTECLFLCIAVDFWR